MSKIVIDASALIALIAEEEGWQVVQDHLDYALMSSINVCEVVMMLTRLKIPFSEAKKMTKNLVHETVVFDEEQAYTAAELNLATKYHGLSLGDRACLSLAKIKKTPVLTADKVWAKLSLGIEIVVIR